MKKLSTFLILFLFIFLVSISISAQTQVLTSSSNNISKLTLPDALGKYKAIDEATGETTVMQVLDFPVYSGFPVSATGTSVEGSIFCNLDSDPELEIVICIGFTVQAFNMDGTPVSGWPKTLSQPTQSAPSFGDIDGDGEGEIVVTSIFGASQGTIHAFEKDGSYVTGFPVSHGYSTRTPVLSDLDDDGDMEIVVNKRTYPTGEVSVYNGDGTVYPGWPQLISSVPASSPAIGDITGDGQPEIIFEAYQSIYVWDKDGNAITGFPFDLPTGTVTSYSSPVLADLDGDNFREIIFGTHESEGALNGKLYVLKNDGTIYSGWPQTTTMWIYSAPAVGYIDNDDILDIAVGDQVLSTSEADKVYAWNAHGDLLSGFPYGPTWAVNAQILLADIDNDNMTELIYDDNTIDLDGYGYYHALNHDGTPVSGWPVQTTGTTFFITPALTDINGDAVMDMIGAGTTGFGSDATTNVYLWNTELPYRLEDTQIPMFQYNQAHNGLYDSPSLVPVELTSFSAQIENKKVLLKWQTATEINNRGFEVQRSTNNKLFNTIGFVEGNGTTTESKDYSYTDNNGINGKVYYRLKQIDFDGSFEYSDVVEIEQIVYDYSLAQNYPNPFNPSTTIKFSIPEKSNVRLLIYNVLGEKVKTLINESREAGNYSIKIDANELSGGIYFYKLETDNFVKVRKMMLLK